MRSRSAILRNILVAIAVVASATACGGEKEDDASRRFEADAPGSRPSNGDAEPGDGTGENGSGSDTGTNSASGGGSKRARPRPAGVPAEGRYRYRFTAPTSDEAFEWIFDAVDAGEESDADGVFRQFLTWAIEEEATRYLVAQKSEGAIVEAEQRARGREVAALCAWTPHYLDTPRDAEAGMTWSVETTCTNEGGGTRTRTMEAEVVAVQKGSLDGRTFKVLVITRHTNTTVEGRGLSTGETEQVTERFAPELGLVISREGTRSSTLQGAPRPARRFKLELLSLNGEKVPYDKD